MSIESRVRHTNEVDESLTPFSVLWEDRLKRAPPGLGIIIGGSDIVLAWLAGMILFHEYADGRTLFGSTIILFMTTALGLHKWKRRTLQMAATKAARKRQSRDRLLLPGPPASQQ